MILSLTRDGQNMLGWRDNTLYLLDVQQMKAYAQYALNIHDNAELLRTPVMIPGINPVSGRAIPDGLVLHVVPASIMLSLMDLAK